MRPRPQPRPRPLARPRLYEQLVQRLCEYIREADLGPGDKLPSEREFAAALGVSRVSLGQALVALEVQGIIEVRHGDGAVIRYNPSDEEVLRVLRERASRRAEIIDARQALEVKLAELAALRRSDIDIAEIDAAIAAMRDEIGSGERGVTGDERFHAAVTTAARSGLLARMMDEISPMILQTRMESLSQPERPRASLAGHQRIADAIRAGDAKEAAEAMRDHLEMVSDVPPLDD